MIDGAEFPSLPAETPLMILEFSNKIENHIEKKYQTVKPQREARDDSLSYAAAMLAWYKIQPMVHPDTDEMETIEADEMVIKWDTAITRSRLGDWNPMRAAFQDEARNALEASGSREVIRKHFPNDNAASGEPAQIRADAMLNLCKSLQNDI